MRFKVHSKLKVQAHGAHALLSRTVRVLQILSAFYIWSFFFVSFIFSFFFTLFILWHVLFSLLPVALVIIAVSYSLSLSLSLLSKISYICCRNNAWKLVHSWPTFLVVQWETGRETEREKETERKRRGSEQGRRMDLLLVWQLPG